MFVEFFGMFHIHKKIVTQSGKRWKYIFDNISRLIFKIKEQGMVSFHGGYILTQSVQILSTYRMDRSKSHNQQAVPQRMFQTRSWSTHVTTSIRISWPVLPRLPVKLMVHGTILNRCAIW